MFIRSAQQVLSLLNRKAPAGFGCRWTGSAKEDLEPIRQSKELVITPHPGDLQVYSDEGESCKRSRARKNGGNTVAGYMCARGSYGGGGTEWSGSFECNR